MTESIASDEGGQAFKVLVALVYEPTSFSTGPKIELCRSIARCVDVRDVALPKVPRENECFEIDTYMYVCLRSETAFCPQGYESVIYAAKVPR